MYVMQQIGFALDTPPTPFDSPDEVRKAVTNLLDRLERPATRRAYRAAMADFSAWWSRHGQADLSSLNAGAAQAYVKGSKEYAKSSTISQRVVCLRRILRACSTAGIEAAGAFDNVALERRNPKWHSTSVPSDATIARLLAAASGSSVRDTRDRALVAMLYSTFVPLRLLRRLTVETFRKTRYGAELVFEPGRFGFRMPCPPNLARYLDEYIHIAGIGMDTNGYLFRTIAGASEQVREHALSQPDIFRIVQRLARHAGVAEPVNPRSLRASGIVRYLRDFKNLHTAAELAGHMNIRTTIRYAPQGTKRKRNRIAYRLEDIDAYDEEDIDQLHEEQDLYRDDYD